MALCKSIEEEFLFSNLKQLIKDSDDPLLKKDVDHVFGDDRLMTILRCKKMKVDVAFETVKKIQHVVSCKYQDVFKKFHPQTLRHVFATQGLGPLKHRESCGFHILTIDAKHWKPREYSLEDLAMTCIMIGFEMSKEIATQENGITVIANVEGLSFSQARQATPFFVKKMVEIILDSLPMRFPGVHFTHMNPIFHAALSIAKNFLPNKLKKRIFLHTNAGSLHGHFSPEILPQRFGGILTDEEAYDSDIVSNLFSPQMIQWHDKLISMAERKNESI